VHRDGVVVSCENGLLDVETRSLCPHDPRYFTQTAVPFGYDGDALKPTRWLEFLDALWGDDVESIAALQEFMGYVISGRLDLDTILLTVGPTRAGKGAIARVLTALVGIENVCGPTWSSLGTDFGLAPLLGKPLAIISDARLSGKDTSVVVERLLAISGRDRITVNRKYREQWSGQLPTRFLIISNELPHLGDASHAIVGRLLVLQLSKSWLGKEDRGLEDDLHHELPQILGWCLDGLDRLGKEGRFTRPRAMDDAVITLQDLASPKAAFVRDTCHRGPALEADVEDLWRAWNAWAEDNGHKPGTRQQLGRDLRAVVPGLRVARPKEAGVRWRRYQGIALKADRQVARTEDQ
jgi:putative DNA primase/helicase